MAKFFVLNSSFLVQSLYKFLSLFLDKEVKEKIKITTNPTEPTLTQLFHPKQLPSEFGGEHPTPEIYWPPIMPASNFYVDESVLVSEEKYLQMIKEDDRIIKRPELNPELV